MIIGGYSLDYFGTSKTWYFNHDTEKYTEGPELNTGRFAHAAGKITHQDGGSSIIVVGGTGEEKDDTGHRNCRKQMFPVQNLYLRDSVRCVHSNKDMRQTVGTLFQFACL